LATLLVICPRPIKGSYLATAAENIKNILVCDYNVGKEPHWYDVQVSDTTMLPNASLPGQQLLLWILESNKSIITDSTIKSSN